jgi:hypothetical protein
MANIRRDDRPAVATLARGRRGRRVREALNATTGAAAFGPIEPGCEVFVLSKGLLTFGDAVAYLLETAGPADLVLSTWAAAPPEIRGLRRLLDAGAIRSLQLSIDPSFVSRQRAYTALLRSTFGAESIRLVVVHAKLAVVTNDAWALVLRSSANLNANHRLESFDLSDDRVLADHIRATLGEWFEAPAGDQWDTRPGEHRRRFQAWHPDAAPSPGLVAPVALGRQCSRTLAPATDADAAFFGSGPFDTDLRRVGLTYER